MSPLTLLAERSEQHVWAELWRAIPPQSKDELGIRIKRFLDADAVQTTGIPDWLFNRVIGLGLEQTVSEQDIEDLIKIYHSEGVPLGISLCPEAQINEMETYLPDRGFSVANYWVKMLRDNTPAKEIQCDLRIEPATKKHQAVAGNLIATGFGLNPDWSPIFSSNILVENNHVYIAWDDDTPAAVGVLSIYKDVGHLNTAATLPDYRGHGLQGAIMARRIEDGIKLGCKHFVSETWDPGLETNHSYNNMLRHGFSLLYKRPNWVLPVSQTSS